VRGAHKRWGSWVLTLVADCGASEVRARAWWQKALCCICEQGWQKGRDDEPSFSTHNTSQAIHTSTHLSAHTLLLLASSPSPCVSRVREDE
jgi:hypothetical protein